jgi:hypothetical protein
MNRLVAGAAAGALGTLALEATTYADVLARGRPPSQVPAETAGTLAQEAGVELDENRRSGLGALMGYATGVGVGALVGLLRPAPLLRRIPAPIAAGAVGAAAMAAGNAVPVAKGITEPADWGTAGWLADIVPHTIYGLVTLLAFDRLVRR